MAGTLPRLDAGAFHGCAGVYPDCHGHHLRLLPAGSLHPQATQRAAPGDESCGTGVVDFHQDPWSVGLLPLHVRWFLHPILYPAGLYRQFWPYRGRLSSPGGRIFPQSRGSSPASHTHPANRFSLHLALRHPDEI